MPSDAQNVNGWYQATLKQIAGESFFQKVSDLANPTQIRPWLLRGNSPENPKNPTDAGNQYVRMVAVQADKFLDDFQIVDQVQNTSSGFSATLLRERASSGKYSLVFRSTEYKNLEQGGDFQRDGYGGAGGEIYNNGFAFGQLRDMEWYLGELKAGRLVKGTTADGVAIQNYLSPSSGGKLEVEGYSLGAHLATVFTELHVGENLIEKTILFNASGRGTIGVPGSATTPAALRSVLNLFDAVLANPNDPQLTGINWTTAELNLRNAATASGATMPTRDGGSLPNPASVYGNARYQWARAATTHYFDLRGVSNLGLGSPGTTAGLVAGAAPLIDQLYGHATHDDREIVANSGVHALARPIFIEDQPEVEGLPKLPIAADLTANFKGDFGNTHSLTLVVDSLAVMRAYMAIDPSLTIRDVETIFAGASNQRAQSIVAKVGAPDANEGDSLENALDSLRKLFGTPGYVTGGATVQVITDVNDPRWLTPIDRSAGTGIVTHRDTLYRNLDALLAAQISGKGYRILSLTPVTQFYGSTDGALNGEPKPEIVLPQASGIVEGANLAGAAGLAYRYALRELNPFVVLDEQGSGLYGRFQTGGANEGELYFYSSTTAPKGQTQQYLADRAAFLERKLYVTTLNLTKNYQNPNTQYDPNSSPSSLDGRGQGYQGEAKAFKDLSSGFVVSSGSTNRNSEQQYIFGGDGNDLIDGAGRDDRLYGGGGTDFVTGAYGDDYLEGGTGFDVYQSKSGEGKDTVLDADGKGILTRGGQALSLGVKQTATTWVLGGTTYTKDGADLVITFSDNAEDKVTLKDFDFTKGQTGGYLGIRLAEVPGLPSLARQVEGDLEPLDVDPGTPGLQTGTDDLGNLYVTATPAADRADTLFGSDGQNGGDPNDYINGKGGADTITAKSGDDLVQGGAGRDTIDAGIGNDLVEAGANGAEEGDIVQGGGGADRLYAAARFDAAGTGSAELSAALTAGESQTGTALKGDFLSGGAGDDVAIGGVDSDVLTGGGGADILIGGAGSDYLFGDSNGRATTLDWTVMRSQSGLYPVPLLGDFAAFVGVADVGDDAQTGTDTIYAGAGDDWVSAGAGNDFVDAGSGNDFAFGGSGDDSLFGGAGGDVLDGDYATNTAADSGNDYLDGGVGSDWLFGHYGNDILIGGAGEDRLFGGEGNDVLYGGAGQDTLFGGAGKDTYVFNRGDGVEVIQDTPTDANSPEASVLALGEGISRSDVKFRLGSLKIDFGGGDAIHLDGFDKMNPLSTVMLDSLQFADGSSMTYADVLAQGFDLDGTEDDDYIEGTGVTDRIAGFGGNDTLVGLSGEDTLTGGTGNDLLMGGAGRDTYVFGRGDGTDLVDDLPFGAEDAEAPVLELGEGIAPTDVKFRLGAGDSLKVDTGEGDTISFTHFNRVLPTAQKVLGEIRFDGGEAMSYADVLEQGFDLEGTTGNDLIFGTGVTDRIFGFAGEDVLAGEAGDDVIQGGADGDDLDGGAGNDVLEGGTGNDSLVGGDGDDVLIGGEGADAMVGGAGDDIVFAGDGDIVADFEGENTLDLTDYAGLTVSNLELTQYEADGGETYLNLHVRDPENQGATPQTGGVSVVSGELGGFGTVTLADGSGGTVSLSHEQLMSQYAAGGIVFRGTEGADAMFGSSESDQLFGAAGADTLQGNAGNDLLDGGAGADSLDGGAGNDSYVLAFNGGRDTVIEDGAAGSTNTVRLEPGITQAMLRAEQSGNDLVLGIGATSDALVVKDFYLRSAAWQESWTIQPATGASLGIAALQQVAPPTASGWLAQEKADYRTRREQVFGTGRKAQAYAPIGGNAYQKVSWNFNYPATSGTTVPTTHRLNVTTLNSAAASINATASFTKSSTISTTTHAIGRPEISGIGAGRTPVAPVTGTVADLPEGSFVPLSNSFGGLNVTVIPLHPSVQLIPEYGPVIGVPQKGLGTNKGAGIPLSQLYDPNVFKPIGYRVHHLTPPPSNPAPARLVSVVNPVQTTITVTAVNAQLNLADVVGASNANTINASSAVVEAGAGNDTVTLNVSDYLPGADWRATQAFDAAADPLSPSTTRRRFASAHTPVRELIDGIGDEILDTAADRENFLGGFVDAGAGNDTVTGSAGQDLILGGDGIDALDGSDGADTYLYAASETGIDNLADSGSSTFAYFDWYYRNQGILNWDERMLFGGKYRIGNNDGASRWTNTRYFPTLAEAQDRTSNDAVVSFVAPLAAAPLLTRSDVAMLDQLTAAGVLARDVVEFGPGLTLGDLAMALSADGGTLSVRWGAAGFNLGIPTASFGFGGASLPASILEIEEDFFSAFDSFEYDLGLASALSAYRLGAGVEAFRFADGSSFTLEQILRLAGSQVSIVGTAGNDILSGGAAGERIAGLGGNDTLSGNGGNDTVSGGPGNDTLSGGAGSDGLYGSAGNDAYLFNRGDGADIVYDYDELAGNSDTIRFGASVAPADIAFSRTGNNLVLRNVASGDTVTAQAHYTAAGRIERFEFANGTGVTLRDASSIIFGTGQSDEIGGTENGESIFGYAGDDWISAGAGDDAIFGGGGDDFLAGDAGDDTYVYEAGGGVDGIYDSGGTDSVRFGAGIAPEDVTVFADPWGSLYLSVENPGNRLELYNWFDGGFKVEQAVFADGTVWNAAQLESRITQPSATEFSDLLFLTGGDDVVDALGGDDEVHGLGGNDILSGGAGADRVSGDEGHNLVTGGTGNDRVESGEVEEARNLFIGGAGDDRILAYGTANVVAFNPGDGEDFLQAGYGAPLTLSIGSASAADIVLSWVTEGEGETSLRIGVSGAGGVRTFAYNEGTQNGPAATLQLIGADIRTYDLNAVVQAFFAASELEEISVWSAAQALADNLLTVSTTEALGGDIAYRYARTGGIDGLATEEQQAVLASDAFALAPQPITFIASNRAPTLDHPVADQAANEDAAFGFTLPADAFSDPDAGDLLSYTATLADGSPLPGWLSFDAQAGTFSGTPLQSNTGLLNLKVTATDAAGLFADDSFALAIANSNDAPADIALSANLVAENAPDALVGTLSTADEDAGDTFTYSIVPGGDGAQFAISGDALRVGAAGLDFEAGATRGVTVRSTDAAGAFFDQAITVNVGDVNEAPLLANAIADRNAAEDAAFSFTVPVETFADPDAADVLTWFAARPDGGALPAWLAFDGETRSFSGTPAQADVGTLELRVTASDGGGLSASGAFALTVANVNDTPAVANDILDQSFEAGAQLVFSLASNVFIDEDGESPALSASLYGGGVLPAWLSFNASTGTFTGNPLASNIGISHLAVTATDAAGASAVSDFGLIVRAAAGSSVTGGAGDDVIYGGTGDETLVARGGRDYLNGDTGNDLLRGGGGDDVLQGGADADALRGGVGQNLLDGGTGDDLIYGGQGSAFITGGAGNDTLRVGQGNDVIAFNAGDGIDTVYGGRDGGNTLSFGGSIGYEDLSLSRSGRDLVVSAGENDRIVLKNWYNGNHSVLSLQLILDATEAFDAGSADPLFNKRVQRFDFAGLVSAFDQARAASPGLTSWAVTNALLQFHLSGADDAALGGDLAYWYGRNNSLTGISLAAAQQVIGAPGFGSDAQTLRPFSGLQDGFVKLS